MDEGQKLNMDLQSVAADIETAVEIKLHQWYKEVDAKGEERHDLYWHVVEIHDGTLLVYTDQQERRTINRILFEIDLEEGRLVECEPPERKSDVGTDTPD